LLKNLSRIVCFLLVPAGTWGCGRPQLDAVAPNRGYPRQLLAVEGTTAFAGVVWNVGQPNEKVLYSGLFGTQYFQIPADASAGTYEVALRNRDGTSGSVAVTVLPASNTFPAPRIEDIGLLAVGAGGPVDLALTVTAANLDVDATVTVTETVGTAAPASKTLSATVQWGGLPVDYLQDHQPDTFGYPIYHYTQLLSVVKNVSVGSTLLVTVTNTDGQQASRTYTLPASFSDLDSDGDGLLDSWEDASYTAPSGGTIPLAAMGARKWRKDVLVEVDWIAAAQPDPAAFPRLREAFARAPVLNPDGSAGVNLIIDFGPGSLASGVIGGGEVLNDHDMIAFGNVGPVNGMTVTNFFDYKNTHFNPDRRQVFHYAIFGKREPNGNSGRGEVHGNDFYVTLVDFPWSNNADGQVGSFIHELGHNLGLSHGDLNPPNPQASEPFKPNVPSVMTYWYTFRGVDIDCDMQPDGLFTYSQGTLQRILEATVNENSGICDGKPVDMNPVSGLSVGVDVNQDNDLQDQWDDFDQWGNLLLDFDAPGSRWQNN
jgi:hypothetical protein